MRGMTFKFVVIHHDDESEEKIIGTDEAPVARITWQDEADKHMHRVGGQSQVQAHFMGLMEQVRKGLGPTTEVLLQKVLRRFEAEGKKARGGVKREQEEEADE